MKRVHGHAFETTPAAPSTQADHALVDPGERHREQREQAHGSLQQTGLFEANRPAATLKTDRRQIVSSIERLQAEGLSSNDEAQRLAVAQGLAQHLTAACDVLDLALAQPALDALKRMAGQPLADSSSVQDYADLCEERMGECQRLCNTGPALPGDLGCDWMASQLAARGFTFELRLDPRSSSRLEVVPQQGSTFQPSVHAGLLARYLAYRTKAPVDCEAGHFMALASFLVREGALASLDGPTCGRLVEASLDLASHRPAEGPHALLGLQGFHDWLVQLACRDDTGVALAALRTRCGQAPQQAPLRSRLVAVLCDCWTRNGNQATVDHGLALLDEPGVDACLREAVGRRLMSVLVEDAACDDGSYLREGLLLGALDLQRAGRSELLQSFSGHFLATHESVKALVDGFDRVCDVASFRKLVMSQPFPDAPLAEVGLVSYVIGELLRRALVGHDAQTWRWERVPDVTAALLDWLPQDLLSPLSMLQMFAGMGRADPPALPRLLTELIQLHGLHAGRIDELAVPCMAIVPRDELPLIMRERAMPENDEYVSWWIDAFTLRSEWEFQFGDEERLQSAAASLGTAIHRYVGFAALNADRPKVEAAGQRLKTYVRRLQSWPEDEDARLILQECRLLLGEPSWNFFLG